jgi:hypothetical protein
MLLDALPRPAAPARCQTLAAYIEQLVERLADGEPASAARLREVVGARRARITLDAETVEVRFEGLRLVAEPDPPPGPVDGEGRSDRLTTLALLDGTLEVTDALLEGRLHAIGEPESLARIFQAIEILLDAATRVPRLPRLSLDYERDPCRPARPPWPGASVPAIGQPWRASARAAARAGELALLDRLDLLP